MPKRVVILGGGTGGTLSANRLRRLYPTDDLEIVVVDQDDAHVYQPGLLFVPFGLAHADEIVRSRAHQLHKGIEFRQVPIDHVDTESDSVQLQDGTVLEYDALVVATGSVLVEEETEGLTGPGWREKVFTFYDRDGAVALHDALEYFEGGRVVVQDRFTGEGCLALIEEHAVNRTQMVPAHFVRILETDWTRYDTSSIRLLIHAAAMCPVHLKWRILEVFPRGTVWEL